MRWAQIAHRWLILLMMAGVALQFFLAGAGAFFATDFDVHRAVGYALIPVGAVAFSFAAAAGRYRVMTLVALVLLGVQAALGAIAADTEPWVGGLHGMNALAVGAVVGTLTGRLFEEARAERAGPAGSREPVAGRDPEPAPPRSDRASAP